MWSKARLLALAGLILVSSFSPTGSMAAGRRPSGIEAVNSTIPVNYFPQVERLADRYRLTIQTPDSLPHYLIERSPKKIWLRLVRPSVEPSQILEGDTVISEVRLVRRQYSSDMIVKLGDDAVSNDIYFDEGKKNIVVDVFTSDEINRQRATAPVAKQETPVLKTKAQARAARKTPKVPVITAASAPVIKSAAAPVLKASVDYREPVISRSRPEVIVVVDAGHGGMDSGAIGVRGTLEKDINLDFAKQLSKALAKEKNMRVVMTRNSDEFIALQDRARIANNAAAHVFVSIHCNSSLSPKHDGFETYFLSPDATDKAAAAVARVENSVVALEAKKGEHKDKLNELLASMAVGNFINESSKFATLLCRNIRSHTSVDKTEVKEADFYVLRGAQMPAVLVELDYLSNPVSELRLRSSRYRSQLVKGVVEGIKSYDKQVRQEKAAMASQLPQD